HTPLRLQNDSPCALAPDIPRISPVPFRLNRRKLFLASRRIRSCHQELPMIFFKRMAIVLIICSPLTVVAGDPNRRVPTIEDLLQVKTIGSASISPDGKWVAYTVGETDFKKDSFPAHIWLADTTTGRTLQLTRGDKSEGNLHWSPNGQWLAFTS